MPWRGCHISFAFRILSLMLFLTTGILWVRSYLQPEEIFYTSVAAADSSRHEGSSWMVGSDAGCLIFRRSQAIWTGDFAGRARAWWRPPGLHWDKAQDPGDVIRRYTRVNGLLAVQRSVDHRDTAFSSYYVQTNPMDSRIQSSSSTVLMSYWLLSFLFFFCPTLHLIIQASRKRRTHHRIRCGLCLRCGYDLRSSPGCCPECGSRGRKTGQVQ